MFPQQVADCPEPGSIETDGRYSMPSAVCTLTHTYTPHADPHVYTCGCGQCSAGGRSLELGRQIRGHWGDSPEGSTHQHLPLRRTRLTPWGGPATVTPSPRKSGQNGSKPQGATGYSHCFSPSKTKGVLFFFLKM